MPRLRLRAGLSPMTIALLLGVLLAVLRLLAARVPPESAFASLSMLDARAIDLRLLARGREPASPEVVIVAVDNASIARVGRWPWPRSKLAELLDRIDAAEPAVLGFDIVQSEATAAPDLSPLAGRVDPSALSAVTKALEEGSPEDRVLAESVKRSGRVVLGYFFEISPDEAEVPSDAAIATYGAVQSKSKAPGEGGESHISRAKAVVPNIPIIAAAGRSNGYFNTMPDIDGIRRRVPMVVRFGDRMALPLTLSMLVLARPELQPRLRVEDFGVESVMLGKQRIPVAEDGQLLLNFRGRGQTFRHIAAADLLEGKVESEALRGKLVLVGVTATAVADVRATPFDGNYPGVEIHATVLDNILTNDFLSHPRWVVLVEMAAIFGSVLLLGFALGRTRGVTAALFAAGIAGLYLGASQWLFLAQGVPLGIFFPLAAIALVYMTISVHHYITVDREKKRTRDAFSRYLSPELANLVSENPEMLALGGTRRCLTVLFSDIRGFTSISEGLEPETLVEILNVYLGEMTEIIFEHEGTLDKYIGDAIMAVWGAPVDCDDQAAKACSAALAMGARLRERREEWSARGWPRIDAGIGLHTGDMVSGNMGSSSHLSYTVIGDNVNLGSRLEGLTKNYGVSLLVSEATREQVGDAFIARELDIVAVKGKALPVKIFELVGKAADIAIWQDLVSRFEENLRLFRLRQWAEAESGFESILADYPEDGPSKLYIKRCKAYAADPPPDDWRGVTVMETK